MHIQPSEVLGMTFAEYVALMRGWNEVHRSTRGKNEASPEQIEVMTKKYLQRRALQKGLKRSWHDLMKGTSDGKKHS